MKKSLFGSIETLSTMAIDRLVTSWMMMYVTSHEA